MRAIKKFDYFRKTDQKHKTRTGGIVSLLSVATILFLTYNQLLEYQKPNIKKDTFVAVDIENDEAIPMQIDVVFPKCPCAFLTTRLQTGYETIYANQMTNLKFDTIKSTTLEKYDSKLMIYNYEAVMQRVDDLAELITEGQGCRVHGKIDLPIVPGKLLFTNDRVQWHLQVMVQKKPDIWQQFSFDHFFNELNFGTDSEREEILKRFSDYPEHTKFDMVKSQSAKAWNTFDQDGLKYNNYKFAVVVPHVFVDNMQQGQERDFTSYSYSFTQNRKKAVPEHLLGAQISFEFSPVSMKITKEPKPLAKFAINLCAIVGGVFVVFGIINSSVQNFKHKLRDD